VEGIARKTRAIDTALALHAESKASILALATLGGREQAAICGAVLAARAAGIPVILDGFICTAAILPLHAADPALLDHCLVAHASAEPGHAGMVEALGKAPILDLGMRLGEGSGAALALGVLKAALACHNGMATFADAGVSGG
ncbi:nicotinate-nucleotide--dimethylbenzimidazole phosphoribosyltransferase, partial [Pseudaestuariivita sp.]|uniref:nicotinate-nucleotide--dimethylbenzimidazole phosphoribosyltransferase n=1 Tax=Pseudaestuariivita sp. TaxID=2211669 RepID=UPI0040581D96